MDSHTITDLRRHLFDALNGLKDPKQPLDIDRAKAIADVSQTIINTAKIEIEHMKITGGNGSGFIPDASATPAHQLVAEMPGVRVLQHRLKG